MNVPRRVDSSDATHRCQVHVVCRIERYAVWAADRRAHCKPLVSSCVYHPRPGHRADDTRCIDRADAVIVGVGNPDETIADGNGARIVNLRRRRRSTVSSEAGSVSASYPEDLPACRVTNGEIDPVHGLVAKVVEVEIGLIRGYALNEEPGRLVDGLTTRLLPISNIAGRTGPHDCRNGIRAQIHSTDHVVAEV